MLIDAAFRPAKAARFIALEGVNGAGKSTLQDKLKRYLTDKGLSVVTTREPGGTELGKKLRSMLLNERTEKISPWAELFLFSADRTTHVDQVITPALSEGKIVITDRYFYSTIAFQGYGRGLDLSEVQTLCRIAVREIVPDLVILLDLDPLQGLKRNKSPESIDKKDAFESEELAFHQRIRDGFLTMARDRSEPFLVLDASKGPDAVFNEIKSRLAFFGL